MILSVHCWEVDFFDQAMGYFEDIQKIVRMIPQGKVATYGDVARAAGYPGTARQVAWALRDSIAKRLPWQRVLGSGGKILLPGESGLHQRTLLEVEGVGFKGSRVDMDRYEFAFLRENPIRKKSDSTPRKQHHRGKRKTALQPRESARFSNTKDP
jgi:methylated-DNA-protein-cysteine methyltransferase related protein